MSKQLVEPGGVVEISHFVPRQSLPVLVPVLVMRAIVATVPPGDTVVLAPPLTVAETIFFSFTATVTVFEQELFASLLSETKVLGSTEQAPPPLGLTKVVVEFGVTGTVTVTVPLAGITTLPPEAVQLKSLEPLIVQATVPVVPPPFTAVGVP